MTNIFDWLKSSYMQTLEIASALTEPAANDADIEALHERRLAPIVAELESFSDAELRDLDLTRGNIAHAVRYGRRGCVSDLRPAA